MSALDAAAPPREGEALDEAALAGYLATTLGLSGPLSVRQFPKGHSNLTYLVTVGDTELVVRRPPFGSKVKTAHDMGREFRILSRLAGHYPAPTPLAHCVDTSVLGAEFYVMKRIGGVILRKDLPEGLELSPVSLRAISAALIDTLADLHALDYGAIGLGDLGKPEGYVARQVTGWTKRYEASKTDDVPAVDRIAAWLLERLPPEGASSLIHNDFKLDNVMLYPSDPTRIVGVLDWEMSTLGDPMMDLGTTLSYWMEPSDSEALQMIRWAPTTLPGCMTRRELAERYSEKTGRSVENVVYYYCFGLWKTAVVLQQIYFRYKQGLTRDPRFAALIMGVHVLAQTAVDAADSGKLLPRLSLVKPVAGMGRRSFMRPVAPLALAVTALLACTPARPPLAPKGAVADGTPDGVNIAMARARKEQRGFEWLPFSEATFARAKAERRFILIDGAAEWCHWCHVMDETTYRDPEVGRLLRERFVAIKVDVDERPDIGDRYAAYGWPATVLLSPEAEELGKYKGYLPAIELVPILRDLNVQATSAAAARDPGDTPLPVEALPWIAARVSRDMDGYYDDVEGGWGVRQKAPIGANVEVEIERALRGDAAAGKRATFTLSKQRVLIDPVWGGMSQYSAGRTWDDPHFEKLMSIEAASIEAYARGYALTRDARHLDDGARVARYVMAFLTDASGAFLVSQDADLNAHDSDAPFMDGHVYYAKPDAQRRALGIPRVDRSVYPHENGLAIAAFVTLAASAKDPSFLAPARRAADVVLRSLVASGRVKRDAKGEVRFLADSATFGWGLARLAEATGESAYLDAALSISRIMFDDFRDGPGALVDRTIDPAAVGVFARRSRPFAHNVTAARFLCTLARVTKSPDLRDKGKLVLAATSTPKGLDGEGRMVGAFLLALGECGVTGGE